jgi:hypothetical protein
VPRKYRPPASSKRRKKRTSDYDFPVPEETGSETAVADGDSEVDNVDVAVEASRAQARRSLDEQRSERHVRRDYTYVRNEAIRIGIIGGVLIAGIVVAGFFR